MKCAVLACCAQRDAPARDPRSFETIMGLTVSLGEDATVGGAVGRGSEGDLEEGGGTEFRSLRYFSIG